MLALAVAAAVSMTLPSTLPPVYSGPVCATLTNVAASIPLDESGLVIEVADSVVAPGERGLFVRCEDANSPVILDAPSPFCGYADGSMHEVADAACGKSVSFAIHSSATLVFFEGALVSVGELLQAGFEIASYTSTRDPTTGACIGLERDDSYDGPLHFIPTSTSPLPEDLTIMNIGQMANDLAIDADKLANAGRTPSDGSYSSDSKGANLLALVQRLERADASTPNMLVPSRPISTLARSTTIANTVPMEVGCEYGARYWGMAAAAAGGE